MNLDNYKKEIIYLVKEYKTEKIELATNDREAAIKTANAMNTIDEIKYGGTNWYVTNITLYKK